MNAAAISALAIMAAAVAGCGGDDAPSRAASDGAATPPRPAETGISLADAGRRAFGPCAVCHSVAAPRGAPRQMIGPNLRGVVGRRAGGVDGFAYSAAMLEAGLVWDEATLDAFIEKPNALVRGTRMAFVGEPDPAKRAAIIAYLKSLD